MYRRLLLSATTLLISLPLLYASLVPIKNINEEAYFGVWFQVYASATVKYTFELGGNCVTAEYNRTGVARTFSVKNIVRPFQSFNDGTIPFGDCFFTFVVEGYGVQSNSVDGQIEVNFPKTPGLPAIFSFFNIGQISINDTSYQDPGNYWIINLGPINSDGLYDYSIVTNNAHGEQLYVLARNVTKFENVYEHDVLQKLEAYGFNKTFNKPLKTNQKNCNYQPYKFGL